jgi:hypothetical protein
MRHVALGLVGFALSAMAVACASPDTEQKTEKAAAHGESPIIGGTLDTVNHATVALAPANSDAICSGTIIAKNGTTGYVLTAAHCIKGDPHSPTFPGSPPPPIAFVLQADDYKNCFQGQGNPALCDGVYSVTNVQVHPGFPTAPIPMNQSITDDFAIITFSGATPTTPVVPPASSDGLAVGQNLELSGYGLTSYPNGFTRQRHHITLPVDQLFGLQIAFNQAGPSGPEGACNGDSGGPAYKVIGGQQQVVGVTSFGDQGCAQLGVYGRVQAVYNDFIAPIIGAPVMVTCDSCTLSAVNPGGSCFAQVQACQNDTGCNTLYDCLANCAPNDNACVQTCANAATPASINMFNAIFECANCQACSAYCPQTQCGTTSSTTGATTGTGSASTGTVVPTTSTTGAGGAGNGSGGASSTGAGNGNAGGSGSTTTSVTKCSACAVAPHQQGDETLIQVAVAAAVGIAFASRRRRAA